MWPARRYQAARNQNEVMGSRKETVVNLPWALQKVLMQYQVTSLSLQYLSPTLASLFAV